MGNGREVYQTLSALFRQADYRGFSAQHRSGFRIAFLGYVPEYSSMVGFYPKAKMASYFAPDEADWTNLITHMVRG
jgi:hypothetical protein